MALQIGSLGTFYSSSCPLRLARRVFEVNFLELGHPFRILPEIQLLDVVLGLEPFLGVWEFTSFNLRFYSGVRVDLANAASECRLVRVDRLGVCFALDIEQLILVLAKSIYDFLRKKVILTHLGPIFIFSSKRNYLLTLEPTLGWLLAHLFAQNHSVQVLFFGRFCFQSLRLLFISSLLHLLLSW